MTFSSPPIFRNTDTVTSTYPIPPNFEAVSANELSATPGALLTGIEFVTSDVGPPSLSIGTSTLSANASGGIIWGSTAFAPPATIAGDYYIQFVDLAPVILSAG